jgi:GMP synthase (glutamine-hydrolysing)
LRYFQKKQNLKLKIVNAFDKKVDFSSPQKLIKDTQGVILGGSGEFYLSGNSGKKEKIFQEMLKRITPFIKYLLRNDFPTLGICFGHQILGYFLGEKVIADKNQGETGTFLVSLTKEGRKSPLFSGIPPKFFAQFGHRDSLKGLPKGAKLLAKTRKCRITAFRYKDRIWGVQFHPELNYKDMVFRLKLYPEYISKSPRIIKKILIKVTPFSFRVIKNFIKTLNAN